ncbi:alpha/beta hydrolase [Mycobacterium sp. 48b]|uniref:alpha/beta hydrolase n=1 Tax=Mycobacterium sp. 48b TaxID=3400426 RepID=UPI003AB0F100
MHAGGLEVLEKGATTDVHPAPLVFVHGVQHGAWCWDDHFLGYFADHGYRAVALSLRGHGASNSCRVGECSIADFVEDVRTVCDQLPTVPVVVGHSMGGYVVQRYLSSHPAAAAVLLAAVPPSGYAEALRRADVIRTAMKAAHPQQRLEMAQYLRALYFHPDTSVSVVDACLSRLSYEPPVRAMADMTQPLGPSRHRPGLPVLVMGAADDPCITRSDLRATAAAYRATAQVISSMGHDMMLEPGWRDVAERMHVWLGDHCL